MPDFHVYRYTKKVKRWADFSRYDRKQFHRENESRARRGLLTLDKPI